MSNRSKETNRLLAAGSGVMAVAALAMAGSRMAHPPVPGAKLAHEVDSGELAVQPSGELVALFPGVHILKTPVIPNADLGQVDNTSMVVPEGNILIAHNPGELTGKDGKTYLVIDIHDKDGQIVKSFAAKTDLEAEQVGSNKPLITEFLLPNENQPNSSEMIKPSQFVATTAGLDQFANQ